MDKISASLETIIAKVGDAATKSGRNPSDIQIVAASKTRSIETLQAAFSTGKLTAFGENRVQEFLSKYSPALPWDFIGQLQTNKVKYLIGKVRLIHSVDRNRLAAEINRLAQKNGLVQKVLVEINSGAEENKGGLPISEAKAFAHSLAEFPNLELKGIMAVAPLNASKNKLHYLFRSVYEVYQSLQEFLPNVDTLSMGMSNDFETAIECGSNLVRLGRILFDSK